MLQASPSPVLKNIAETSVKFCNSVNGKKQLELAQLRDALLMVFCSSFSTNWWSSLTWLQLMWLPTSKGFHEFVGLRERSRNLPRKLTAPVLMPELSCRIWLVDDNPKLQWIQPDYTNHRVNLVKCLLECFHIFLYACSQIFQRGTVKSQSKHVQTKNFNVAIQDHHNRKDPQANDSPDASCYNTLK